MPGKRWARDARSTTMVDVVPAYVRRSRRWQKMAPRCSNYYYYFFFYYDNKKYEIILETTIIIIKQHCYFLLQHHEDIFVLLLFVRGTSLDKIIKKCTVYLIFLLL